MLKTLDVPTTNISNLKKNPKQIFNDAQAEKTGIYVFNRDTPAGIVMSVNDYEKMVKKLNDLEDKILDLQIEKKVQFRMQNDSGKRFSDKEVRGDVANQKPIIDEDDGWE